jgi:hypothetical protein
MANKALTVIRQILNFPVTRIIIGVVLLNIGLFILRNLAQLALTGLHVDHEIAVSTVIFIIRILGLVFIYILFVRLYERRKVTEISLTGKTPGQLIFGVVTGLLCIGAVIGINLVFGWISIEKTDGSPDILQGVWYTVFFVLLQDFTYFLILFRIAEKYLGTYLTILVAGFIFGFKHLLFPDYTVLSGILIFIEGTFIFSALFLRSRGLWEIFGFHLTYNFLQSNILGNPGNEGLQSVFTVTFNGPSVFTGNESGFESSIIAVIFCILAGGYYLYKLRQKGVFLPPYWKKS